MLTFRKITSNDLQFLNIVRNTYSKDYLHDSRVFTLDETIQWFLKVNPDYYIIEINLKKIGYFRLSNHSIENRNIYIGADIHPDFCGLGYATQAYKQFIPFLFKEYNLNKISLEVLATNDRAIHLYKKLGFVLEGIKRKEVLKNQQWIDSKIMSILKEEYEKLEI